jgi:hypothetical protein
MIHEREGYHSVPATDDESHPADPGTRTGLPSRACRFLWPLGLAVLFVLNVIQSVAIVLLSQNADSSCRSIRRYQASRDKANHSDSNDQTACRCNAQNHVPSTNTPSTCRTTKKKPQQPGTRSFPVMAS